MWGSLEGRDNNHGSERRPAFPSFSRSDGARTWLGRRTSTKTAQAVGQQRGKDPFEQTASTGFPWLLSTSRVSGGWMEMFGRHSRHSSFAEAADSSRIPSFLNPPSHASPSLSFSSRALVAASFFSVGYRPSRPASAPAYPIRMCCHFGSLPHPARKRGKRRRGRARRTCLRPETCICRPGARQGSCRFFCTTARARRRVSSTCFLRCDGRDCRLQAELETARSVDNHIRLICHSAAYLASSFCGNPFSVLHLEVAPTRRLRGRYFVAHQMSNGWSYDLG